VTFFRVSPKRSKAFPPRERRKAGKRVEKGGSRTKKTKNFGVKRKAIGAIDCLVMPLGLCACVYMVWREGRENRNGPEGVREKWK
jgi:hypothetical protein